MREACLLCPSSALIPSTCRGTPVRGVDRGRRAAAVELGGHVPAISAEKKVRKEMQGRG